MSNKNFIIKNGLEVANGITINAGGLTVSGGDITLPSILRIGASSGADRFPNSIISVSNTTGTNQPRMWHNTGLVAEGTGDAANQGTYGVGVYGVGYTNGGTLSIGVTGQGQVTDPSDTGMAFGVRGFSVEEHDGVNVGLLGSAQGGTSNYALYMPGGDIHSGDSQHWELNGDLTFTGQYDVTIPQLIGTTTDVTTINNITLTKPENGSTITIVDGNTLTVNNSVTFTGTDSSEVKFGSGGDVVYKTNKLSDLSSTASSELAGVISDETGTGSLVFAESPSLKTPKVDTSITTDSTTFSLVAANATTVNFAKAATEISIGSGNPGVTTINHNLQVAGNITFGAGATQLSASVITVEDPLIYLANNNPSDIMDIGLLAAYTTGGMGGTHTHTGFIRAATDKEWKLFSGIIPEPDNNVMDFTNATYDDLKLGGLHAATVNKVTITEPANSATLDIADQKAITTADSFTTAGTFPITLTATEATVVTLPATGTLVADGYTSTETATGTTILSKTSTSMQVFTGTLSQIVKLPSTSTLALGRRFTITNKSTGSLTIQNSSSSLLVTQGPNTTATYTVADTVTQNWMYSITSMLTSGATITIPSNKSITTADSFTTAGAFPITLTSTEDTSVTLPASGTLVADGYTTTATAAGTTTLSKTSTSMQVFTGSLSQTVKLPRTSTLVLGRRFTIANKSTGSLTIQDVDTGTVTTQGPKTSATYTVADTGSESWVSTVVPILNSGATVAIPSNKAITTADSFTTAGAFPITLTATNTTNVTLPTSGTLVADGYTTTATASGTTTLGSTATSMQVFTGTSTQTVLLPSTTGLSVGKRYTVINNSTGALTIQTSAGGAISTQAANTMGTYTVTSTGSELWVSAVVPFASSVPTDGYTTTATAAGTTTLTSTATSMQVFSGTSTQTVKLPSTSGLSVGKRYTVVNNSTGALTIQDFGAGAIAIQGPSTTATYVVTTTASENWIYAISPVINSGATITIPNNKSITTTDSFTTAGAFPITLTATNTTNVTLPTSGTLVADGYTTTATAASTTTLDSTATSMQVFTGT